jgi:hypothetical protein
LLEAPSAKAALYFPTQVLDPYSSLIPGVLGRSVRGWTFSPKTVMLISVLSSAGETASCAADVGTV